MTGQHEPLWKSGAPEG